MNLKTAESYLFAYRQGKPNEAAIEKAYRLIENDGEMGRRLQEQIEFDAQLSRAFHAIVPQDGLRQRVLTRTGGKDGKRRPQFAMTAYVAAFCGLAVIVALVIVFALDRGARFPGSETVARIVASANTMNTLDMVPVTKGVKASDLVDWFYMRGFEAYHLPDKLGSAPAVGSRLFRQEGMPVAQVAIEWHDAVIYIFRADSFGVELPAGEEWHLLSADEWEAALRKDGNTCTVVAIRGNEHELKEFLHTLK